jgi:hypothetical protein
MTSSQLRLPRRLLTSVLCIAANVQFRAAYIQSARDPLRHFVAYGSTNKYRPVKNCKASGNTAKRPSEGVYFFSATATPLTMTAPRVVRTSTSGSGYCSGWQDSTEPT